MTTTRVLVRTNVANAELVADTMWVNGAIGIEERDSNAENEIVVIGAFEDPVGARAVCERWTGTIESVDDAAGLDEWRAHATRIQAGAWTVVPEWLAVPADKNDPHCIIIEPGRTFGSGSHESTQLVLALLGQHIHEGDHVLDLGCGSGVLSIGAARAGARSVRPVDIDPASAAVTSNNATLNSVSDIVRPVAPAIAHGTVVDVVLANMLERDLVPLLPAIVSALRVGGLFVTSGHLVDQRSGIIDAHEDLEALSCSETDGWSVLVLVKKGTHT